MFKWIKNFIFLFFILVLILFFINRIVYKFGYDNSILYPAKTVDLHQQPLLRKPHKLIRVLVLSGGAEGGLITLQALKYIEEQTHQPIYKSFDYIVGTSTGAIIAAALSSPSFMQGGSFGATRLENLYLNYSPLYASFGHRVLTFDGFFGSIYSNEIKNQVVHQFLGDALFADSQTNVMIVGFSLKNNIPIVYRSWHAEGRQYPTWMLVSAVTSAPIYFSPTTIHSFDGKHSDVLIDGAIFANNPSLFALMDIMQQYPGHQIMIVSIGAGIVTMPLNSQKMSSWGMFSWLKPLLNLMLSSNVQYTEKSIDLYANANWHDAIDYYRFDVPVASDHDSLSIDPNNLKYFVNLGQSMVKTNKNKFDEVCKRINADD